MQTLFSLIESPFPLDFAGLYQELGIVAERFNSARNLHRALQKKAPNFFVGEFVYGWGNDYAGATVSNLDVTLRTLQAVSRQAKIIVVMQPGQAPHIGKLLELFTIDAVLKYPVTAEEMRAVLQTTA